MMHAMQPDVPDVVVDGARARGATKPLTFSEKQVTCVSVIRKTADIGISRTVFGLGFLALGHACSHPALPTDGFATFR